MRFSLPNVIVKCPYLNCPLGVPVLCLKDNINRIIAAVADIQLLIGVNCKGNRVRRL